jgi:hypothetical protein
MIGSQVSMNCSGSSLLGEFFKSLDNIEQFLYQRGFLVGDVKGNGFVFG